MNSLTQSLKCFTVFIGMFFLCVSSVHAVEVSMRRNTLNAVKGERPYLDILLTNRSAKPIAVENTLHEVRLNEEGEEQHYLVKDDAILVYPEHVVLSSGERITATVRWLGGEKFDTERAFFFKSKEIPYVTHDTAAQKAETSKEQVRFNTVLTVTVAKRLFVTKKTYKPKLKTNFIRYSDSNDGKSGDFIEINVSNVGELHVKPDRVYLKYKIKGTRLWKSFTADLRNTWIVSETESVFIEWPEDVPVEDTKLKFLKFSRG